MEYNSEPHWTQRVFCCEDTGHSLCQPSANIDVEVGLSCYPPPPPASPKFSPAETPHHGRPSPLPLRERTSDDVVRHCFVDCDFSTEEDTTAFEPFQLWLESPSSFITERSPQNAHSAPVVVKPSQLKTTASFKISSPCRDALWEIYSEASQIRGFAELRAFKASICRDISSAVCVHGGATIGIVLPAGMAAPTIYRLRLHGLRHPPDVPGWTALCDGSLFGLVELRKNLLSASLTAEDQWFNYGQAQALVEARSQIVELFSADVPKAECVPLREAPDRECLDILKELLPGVRIWPLHDTLVNRMLLFNVARTRCYSLRSLFRLDRGQTFFDLVRLHYGEEVAFLFAWHSHYLHTLAAFVIMLFPFILGRASCRNFWLAVQSLLSICFGVAIGVLWHVQVYWLNHRWHGHWESVCRWGRLATRVLNVPLKAGVHDDGASTPVSQGSQRSSEEQAVEACVSTFNLLVNGYRLAFKTFLKVLVLVPLVLLEWAIIATFFTVIVWFEMWVILVWGGCTAALENSKWTCPESEKQHGLLAFIMGALPSICEGAFFELILALSKFVAGYVIGMFSFRTQEQRAFAYVSTIFVLELCGKVGFVSVVAVGFVPVWHTQEQCDDNWDFFLFGKWSLSCMKTRIPYQARLRMLESAMKGPMLVSGLVGILVKMIIPRLLDMWRRCSMRDRPGGSHCASCCHYRSGRVMLAPFDFLLRVLTLIFQADARSVGGLKLVCSWPPTLRGWQDRYVTQKDLVVRRRLWSTLLEGYRREYEPFDEYLELLLHFLWISCFSIVWPLGCMWAFLNQMLKFRFDSGKLLLVRRRRFPNTRHMSVAWVPFFTQIVCHVAIIVNIALLVLPYRILSSDLPEEAPLLDGASLSKLTLGSQGLRVVVAFVTLLIAFSIFRLLALRVAHKLAWTNGAPRFMSDGTDIGIVTHRSAFVPTKDHKIGCGAICVTQN